jgi:inorganic triphosphatase YgiF
MSTIGDREIELTLAAAPPAVHAIRTHLFNGHAGRIKRLTNTYFDTPDFRLRSRGLSLRVRSDGARFVQTVKRFTGDPTQRGEWENELPGPSVDLALLPDPDVRGAIGLLLPDELRPVFSNTVEREAHVLEGGGNAGEHVIEVVFDRGEIVADDNRAGISEIELELLKGEPAALFEVAQQLTEVAPVAVEPLSKADRGFALATGQAPAWHKARRPALIPGQSVDATLAAILRLCWLQILVNGPAVLDGSDPEGVHQMRVGLRRLRSALTTFRAVLPTLQPAQLKLDARWLADALGPARDLDVFLGELLPPVEAHRGPDVGLAELRRIAESHRTQAYVGARAAVRDPRYTAFLLRLGAWIEGRGWRQGAPDPAALAAPIDDFAAALLARRRRKARKLGKGLAGRSVPERHELRIACKKLRYACEFFQSIYETKTSARYIGRLASLQDDLGHLNDIAVADQLVRRFTGGDHAATLGTEAAGSAGFVLGWYARLAVESDRKLIKDWREFARAEPFWPAAAS